MWPGPYGNLGSRKYLLASLDQSLRRMGLEYVDVFYHHRPDPETPLEETMGALAHAVRSGKALYVGISNYGAAEAARAIALLRELGAPCLLHQPRYSMLERWVEPELLGLLEREGVGCIAYSPLARGLLTARYFEGIPADSRAGHDPRFLKPGDVTDAVVAKARRLEEVARARGQSLAQLALAWVLRRGRVTSALIGASRPSQVDDCVGAARNLAFGEAELARIDEILAA
jgi:L-glyceraldehyde 3-phosphate reductase